MGAHTRGYLEGIWVGICVGLIWWTEMPIWKIFLIGFVGIIVLMIILALISVSVNRDDEDDD